MESKRRWKKSIKNCSLISHYHPKSPVAEQYRTIRSNIHFASLDNEMCVITLTSASPGEGKSTTATNLAIILAQQGKKVLLIDADMRKPSSHFTFRADNFSGLSTVLINKIPLEDVIYDTPIPNLHLLTCGPIPPNPAELLSMLRMDWLLSEVRKQFNYVIIDTPPILSVTDAQILGDKSDGIILVVSSGQTDKRSAKKAKDLLLQTRGNLLGVVLNKKKDVGYHYYYEENSYK
ncbi:CpsD/CapB family tyrosine-protein kinase [Evansella tamaricis]|uniref:non-specific protein-tyrosine kinase n=1 Tax=Evansella tamaricis TaxID=2069301 RepID=A0ABS6JES8_9BACI|nr:CpsD/CapB family tyrosine-protein kinase [Evansella tamaricis]MBU9712168.1 CpsD/CapB family tyrosine-protein kinase [Evansella tamaricis]